MPGTRKLGRSSSHRMAMLRAMVTFLLENGKIETTVTRAKEVRAMTEKMITTAKTNDLHSKRQVLSFVTKEDVAKKLFDEIAPKYKETKGGYTRIVKILRTGWLRCDLRRIPHDSSGRRMRCIFQGNDRGLYRSWSEAGGHHLYQCPRHLHTPERYAGNQGGEDRSGARSRHER